MTSSLTHEDVTQTLRLVEELPDGELILTKGDFSLVIRKGVTGSDAPAPVQQAKSETSRSERPAPQPAPAEETPAPAASDAKPSGEEGHVILRAPMLGCFYRAASPAERPLVDVGAHVTAGDTVCLIEVMKLFNTIAAEISGSVVAVHAENGAMVEAGAPLFTIKPD